MIDTILLQIFSKYCFCLGDLTKTVRHATGMNRLILPMLRLLSSKAEEENIFDNHINPIMLVFIR